MVHLVGELVGFGIAEALYFVVGVQSICDILIIRAIWAEPILFQNALDQLYLRLAIEFVIVSVLREVIALVVLELRRNHNIRYFLHRVIVIRTVFMEDAEARFVPLKRLFFILPVALIEIRERLEDLVFVL